MTQYATVSNIQDDADDPEFGPEVRVGRLVRTASNIVKDLVNEPPMEGDPPAWPSDFRVAARDATIGVFWYLWDTKGYISGTRVSGEGMAVGDNYQSNPQILAIVARTMGTYAKAGEEGGGEGAAASVHNVTPEPLW